MKALLLVNGELYEPDVARRRIRDEAFDLVVGVDGGARYAKTLNVMVDAVVGDMDSLSDPEQHGLSHCEFVSYPAEKDESDLELALLYARNRGIDRIVMVGAMGGRMETTIANILLLGHASLTSCRIEVWHGEQTGWAVKPPGEEIAGHPGDTLSLIPLDGYASGVTTKGLKYPLKDEGLPLGSTRGLSNVMDGPLAHVGLAQGLLLVVHTPGRA